MNRTIQYWSLTLTIAWASISGAVLAQADSDHTQTASTTLLGESFNNPDQKEIFKLFLATFQPDYNRQNNRVMLSTEMAGGLGDFTYIHKTASLLEMHQTSDDIHLLSLNTDTSTAERIETVFQQRTPRHMLDLDYDDIVSIWQAKELQNHIKNTSFVLNLGPASDILFILTSTTNVFNISEIFHEAISDDPEIKKISSTFNATVGQQLERDYNHTILGIEDPAEYLLSGRDIITNSRSLMDDELSEYSVDSDCSPITAMSTCIHVPAFGIGPGDAGILVDDQLRQKVRQYRSAENPYNTDFAKDLLLTEPAVLTAISGQTSPEQQQRYFVRDSNYHIGYFHTYNGKDSFISAITHAYPDVPIRLVLPVDEDYLLQDTTQLMLKRVGVQTVRLWMPEQGWKDYQFNEVHAQGRTIEIVNPFPLPIASLEALNFFSKPVVGTTGDHSFYAAISMGKLPHHEVMSHQYLLRTQLSEIAREPVVQSFYRGLDRRQIGVAIRKLESNPRIIHDFTSQLINDHSANELLLSITAAALNPAPEVTDLLTTIDSLYTASPEQQQTAFQAMPRDEADIARVRLILTKLSELGQPDEMSPALGSGFEALKLWFASHVEQIKGSKLRLISQEAISDYFRKIQFHFKTAPKLDQDSADE